MKLLVLRAVIAAFLCCCGRCDSSPDDRLLHLVQDAVEKIDAMSARIEELSSRLDSLEELKNTNDIIETCSSKEQITDLQKLLAMDECRLGGHRCSVHASCSDAIIGYHCDCLNGFTGDGFTCQDVDECIMGTDSCSTNAHCTNNVGSYSCFCNDGYSGNGFICVDINECTTRTHTCYPSATCTNTDGNYTCTCPHDYTGNGHSCEVIPCDSPAQRLEDLGCVIPLTEPTTWQEAKDLCEADGYRLLEGITSKKQLKIIRRHFRRMFGYKDAWLGIFNGSWLESGAPIPPSSPLWGEGQPDQGDQLCGYAYIYSSDPYLVDAKCSGEEYAFCQRA